jgi:hypothetical protein
MKHVKISYIGFIALFFLTIKLMLFTSSQAVYPLNALSLDKYLYNRKSQSSTGNTNLIDTTQNKDSAELIFSNPSSLLNDTLILDKIFIENSSITNREVQFYVERGFINTSLVTYTMGFYIEDSNLRGTSRESNPLINNPKAGSGQNYAKGLGIFLIENGRIIKSDGLKQIINKLNDTFLYAGMIFFFPADSKNNALSFLKNQVGLHEFSIDTKKINTTTTNTINRTVWLWLYACC